MQSIIITGASSGIGATLAKRLAKPGVGIVVHARSNEQKCRQVMDQLTEQGARCACVIGDLSNDGVAETLVKAAVENFGGLDVLVANAGFPILKGVDETEIADIEKSFSVMVKGLYAMTQLSTPYLKKSSAGRIVAVSSLMAHVYRPGFPLFPASSIAKAGVENLVKNLSQHLGQDAVTVNAVVPGLIEKDRGTDHTLDDSVADELLGFIPLGRMGRQEEVAALIEFLVSKEASYITGQIMHVSGGVSS